MELLRNSCQVAERALLGLHALTCPRKSLPALCLCVAAQFLMLNYFPHTQPKAKITPQCYKRPHSLPFLGLWPHCRRCQSQLCCPAGISLPRLGTESRATTAHSPAAKPQHQVQGLAPSSTNLSCRPGHGLAHFKLCKKGWCCTSLCAILAWNLCRGREARKVLFCTCKDTWWFLPTSLN